MHYKEYGMEKWLIQTTIQGRLDEEGESTMEYTEAYVDWRYSVEIAMQGAITHIRHKYRTLIPHPSAYGMIGERSVGGHAVDRRGQEFHSLLRGYLTERERCSVNLEDMLKKQIINQDQFRELMDLTTKRIMETESALVVMNEKKTQLENKLKIVEGPLQLGGKILQDDIWSHLLEKTILLHYDNMQKLGDEKRQIEEVNDTSPTYL
jgi:5S rRNA maturation endonuclease (ribonuclease M5)